MRTDIVALVRETVELRKAGAAFTGLCPFHAEKTPSFNVHPARQIFHCFGCGVGGDAIAYLMARDGLTFPEALRELGQRVGIQVEEQAVSHAELEQERRARELREWLLRVNELACRFWEETLWGPRGVGARRYLLEQRQLTEETVRAHRLGYAPPEWDGLVQHLQRHKVPERLMPQLGLVRARQGQGGYYDWFRDRVIMPVNDLQGRAVAFSGRVLAAAPDVAKYINSPETVLFRKGSSLFGLREAKNAIRQEGHALLVEGNFDLLILHQAGLAQAVAPLGTALTAEQVRLLRRFTERVYLCYDGDAAGRAAALKTAPLVVQAELDTRLVQLPDGDDPDSFVRRQGADALRRLMDQARPLVEELIRQSQPKRGAPIEERLQAWEKVSPVVNLVRHPIARQHYLALCAELLDLDEKRLHGYSNRPVPSEAPAATRGAVRPGLEVDPVARHLLELLELLVDHPQLAVPAAHSGILETIDPQEPLGGVLKVLFRLAEEEGPPSAARLLEEIEDPSLHRRAQEALTSGGIHYSEEDAPRVLDDILRYLRRRSSRRQQENALDLNRVWQQTGDDASVEQLLEERFRRARELHET